MDLYVQKKTEKHHCYFFFYDRFVDLKLKNERNTKSEMFSRRIDMKDVKISTMKMDVVHRRLLIVLVRSQDHPVVVDVDDDDDHERFQFHPTIVH